MAVGRPLDAAVLARGCWRPSAWRWCLLAPAAAPAARARGARLPRAARPADRGAPRAARRRAPRRAAARARGRGRPRARPGRGRARRPRRRAPRAPRARPRRARRRRRPARLPGAHAGGWSRASSAAGLELAEPRSGAMVRGDRVRLAQAVGNLVANALEHGDGRGARCGRARRATGCASRSPTRAPACRRRWATSRAARAPGAGGAGAAWPSRPTSPTATAAAWWRRRRARGARVALELPGAGATRAREAMTRRRRAAALLGLALLLGVLAASDVAGREAALRRQLGPTVPVVVVRAPLRGGRSASRAPRWRVREVPERYAPAGRAARSAAPPSGQRAAVAIARAHRSRRRPARGPGRRRRAARSRAAPRRAALWTSSRSAPPDAVVAGARVDVLVTDDGRAGAPGRHAAGAGGRRGARRPPGARGRRAPTPPAGCRACWPRCA